jgi:hypothetical protein
VLPSPRTRRKSGNSNAPQRRSTFRSVSPARSRGRRHDRRPLGAFERRIDLERRLRTHLHACPLTVRHHRPNVRPVIRARQSQVGFLRATYPGRISSLPRHSLRKQLHDRQWVDVLSEVKRVPGERAGESRRASSGGWHRFQDGSRASSGGATALPRRLYQQRVSPSSRESHPAQGRR